MRKDSDEDYGGSDGETASPTVTIERSSMKRSSGDSPGVWNVERDKFPYAIVWTPIPCLTWFLPFVGHMVCAPISVPIVCKYINEVVDAWLQGIADSNGAIHDFAGPYYIGYDDMAFGRPSRYLVLDPKLIQAPTSPSIPQSWDASIAVGDSVYKKRMHNLMYAPLFACSLILEQCSLNFITAVITVTRTSPAV